ncbi:MAG TPA: sulfur transferase domain-containing protein [Salinisphaeraceae bacterium]|nr:sulfur transferase domain-containing protein [Salinisphaeraceae bacterium]
MTDTYDIPGMPNLRHPETGYASGGQPDPDQLQAAADAGIGCVINLRPPSEEHGYDEAAKAAELGLAYHVLGIAGPQDLTLDNARKLDTLLDEHAAMPTLVHCASGNRVGALMALRAAWVQGKSKEEALAIGRRWGLTKAEAAIDKLLS